MHIHITKTGRKVTLTKRERDLLLSAKALLAELAASGGGDIASHADTAADAVGEALGSIEAVKLEALAK